MAVYKFETPKRIEIPLGDDPLFSRVTNKAGICLIQRADTCSWEEFDYLPQTLSANADYAYGVTLRSDIPKGKGFAVAQDGSGNLLNPEDYGYRSPLRIYRGGHVYHLDDTLRQELLDASTTEEPNGYGSYITSVADTGQRIGDEIMRSGRTAEFEQGHDNSDPALTVGTGRYPCNYSETY